MTSSARPRSAALLLAVPASLLCGAGIATQARVNGALAAQLDDGFVAALISFGSGLVILTAALMVFRPARRGLALVRQSLVSRAVPWWYGFAGAAGALFVLSQGLVAPVLGVALFSVGVVCGQTVSGVLIDRVGLGTMGSRPITAQRVFGALLALAAVALAGWSQLSSQAPLWLYLLPFAAGLAIAWQQAVNGQVKAIADSALAASFLNFLVGTIVLSAGVAVHTVLVGGPAQLPANPLLYLGGLIGVVFLALGAVIVGMTGLLLLALGTVSGQLLMSLVLDLVFPVAGHAVQWTTFAGTVLALCAVVIVALSARSRSPR